MGCKIVDGRADRITDPCDDPNGCPRFVPAPSDQTIGLSYKEYPKSFIRNSLSLNNYAVNVSGAEGQAVMYPSQIVCLEEGDSSFGTSPGSFYQPASAANCGKAVKSSSDCSECSDGAVAIYDYFPNELSFGFQGSDTWFAYVYDITSNSGQVGIAAYIIEDEESTTTLPSTTTTDPETGEVTTTPGASSSINNTICHPCAGFTCTPASTQCSYTIDQDIDYTGDPDCPHPTLFGIGTGSKKVVFEYNSLSTTIPNGVTDLSVSYDGVNYSDAWNEGELEGIQFDSPQNTWQAGDEGATTFTVYTLETAGKTGLQVNIRIEPIKDESVDPTVFSGTRWTVLDIVQPGTGYAVNDTFNITHDHIHPDNSTTTFTLTIKITTVGPIPSQSGTISDLLRSGDTLNGHTITRVLHGPSVAGDFDPSLGYFPYHFAYLDGNGSDFTKNTDYTSNRNHDVKVIAGYGIKDVGFFGGLYEFTEKSVQYATGFVDKNAPDVYNTLIQPDVSTVVANGTVVGAIINTNGGGSGWDTLGRTPELSITAPYVASGTPAEVEGEFTNGVLTGITIKNGGSGYSGNNLPQISVVNIHKKRTEKFVDESLRDLGFDNLENFYKTFPDAAEAFDGLSSTKIQEILADNTQRKEDLKKLAEQVTEVVEPNIEIKLDPKSKRRETMVQKQFARGDMKSIKEVMLPKQSYKEIDGVDLGPSALAQNFKKAAKDNMETLGTAIENLTEDFTQDVIPEIKVYDETFIQTVQGPFSELPYASNLTKYILRQYRPDNREQLNIRVTLGVTQQNVGKAHFSCSASASSRPSVTDPNTGAVTSSTFTFPFGQVPQGPGCQNWSASGDMIMRNDFTNAAQTMAKATRVYGNPYLVT